MLPPAEVTVEAEPRITDWPASSTTAPLLVEMLPVSVELAVSEVTENELPELLPTSSDADVSTRRTLPEAIRVRVPELIWSPV